MTALAIALAVGAGVIAWLGGRRMVRLADDPLFVERLFAHRMKMTYAHSFAIIIAGFLAGKYALPIGVVALLAIAVGGFPARRVLYGETWTLGQYLASRVRLIVMAGAPWFAIAAAPYVLQRTSTIAAVALFLVIFAALRWQQPLLLIGLRATPLRDEALLRLLDPILDVTQAPRPRIFEGGSETGRFTNAFALPDGKNSRVVLTRALLRELEPQETAAIFAHEAAHLEEWATRPMRIRLWTARILVPLLSVAPQTLMATQYPQAAAVFSVWWPILFLILLLVSMVRRQASESKADLRALELGADPHALIGALEKVHRHLGTPRRMDAPREARMTHPSLARRIRAIRKAAGLDVAPPPDLPRELATRKPGLSLRFTNEGLELGERIYRYDALQSLLVRQTLGGWELMGRSGKERLRVPLTAESAVEAQAILDSIDTQLTPADARPRVARSVRLAAVLLALVSMFPAISFAAVAAAVVALIFGSAPALAAAGVSGIAAGIFALVRDPSIPYMGDVIRIVAVAVALLGVICIVLAAKIPDRERGLSATIVALSIFTAIALIAAFLFVPGEPLTRLFLVARDRPSVTILLAGLAAALAFAGRWRTAFVPAIAVLAFVLCGTHTIGKQLNVAPLHNPVWTAAPNPFARRTIEGMPSALRLSPSGHAFALRVTQEDEDPSRFALAASLTSAFAEVGALDVTFIDDTQLLRYDIDEEGSRLDSIDVTGEATGWIVDLPALWQPRLQAERGEWIATGLEMTNSRQARLRGSIGQPGYRQDGRPPVAASMLGSERELESGIGPRVATHTPTAAIVWNLASGKAMRIRCDDCMILDVALSDEAAGVLLVRDQTTTLELYSTAGLR